MEPRALVAAKADANKRVLAYGVPAPVFYGNLREQNRETGFPRKSIESFLCSCRDLRKPPGTLWEDVIHESCTPWVFRDVVFQDVGFQTTSLKPLTHISCRREVHRVNQLSFSNPAFSSTPHLNSQTPVPCQAEQHT